MKKRYKEEQIIKILKEAEAGVPVKDLRRRHGFSEANFHFWRNKFGRMEVPDAKRLKSLEAENAKLKKLLAAAMLENEATKEVLRKSGNRTGASRGSADNERARNELATCPARGWHDRLSCGKCPGLIVMSSCDGRSWKWLSGIAEMGNQ